MVRDYSIDVVKRAFQVLGLLAESKHAKGITEIARDLDISRDEAFRLLHTLQGCGCVERDSGGKGYTLGIRLFELGSAVFRGSDLRELARPILQGLWTVSRETVNMAIRRANEIVYIERLESPQSLKTSVTVGSHAPLHSTSLGKAILAALPQDNSHPLVQDRELIARTPKTITSRESLWKDLRSTRERGYAVDNEENVEGVCCVGSPVFDESGQPVAAISVSGPVQRMQSPARLKEVGQAVSRAALELSRRLGYMGVPQNPAAASTPDTVVFAGLPSKLERGVMDCP